MDSLMTARGLATHVENFHSEQELGDVLCMFKQEDYDVSCQIDPETHEEYWVVYWY